MTAGVVHCKKTEYDVYIGRPGPWGNPFRVSDQNAHWEAVSLFETWGNVQPWLQAAAAQELRAMTLGCWCAPKPCHGDVLYQWANAQRPVQWIFVFGSNEAGHHGKGAAKDASRFFGAKAGIGQGPTGQAYALPTKDAHLNTLSPERIADEAGRLADYARSHPNNHFQLTRVGCGLAGYADEQVAPIFAAMPDNVHLPGTWRQILDPGQRPRVVVCGGRDFDDEAKLAARLDQVVERFNGDLEIVSGGAKGADYLGEAYAVRNKLPFVRFPALWRTCGAGAGPMRNRQLMWYATHVVAFWNGRSRGTANAIDTARQEGLPLWQIQA